MHFYTSIYIAMAKAAEEIQAMRPDGKGYQDGDAFAEGSRVEWIGDYHVPKGEAPRAFEWGDGEVYAAPSAWLPRLDQLLALWADNEFPPGLRGFSLVKTCHEPAFIDLFSEKAIAEWKAYLSQFKDWHEAVLALKMAEKWGKFWDGKAWVK